MTACVIKVRQRGAKTYSFLTSKGGTNRLRIHAARFEDKDGQTGEQRAQRVVTANRQPGWEWKVEKA